MNSEDKVLEKNKCYSGNNLELLQNIENNSVDMYLFSPPYDNVRDYIKGEWLIDLPRLGLEISRTLKDGGVCVMVIQDQTVDGRKSTTSFHTIVDWVDNAGLGLWECCLYERSGTPGAWWNRRFRVDHEYIPIFIKGKRPQYFSKEHMMIDNPNKGKSGGSIRNTKGELVEVTGISPDKKCCGTIMKYASSSREGNGCGVKESHQLKLKHPATFPDKIAKDFIQAFTTEGMLVVDPFAGSGTTLCMAKELKRDFIGFEMCDEYIEGIINPRLLMVS